MKILPVKIAYKTIKFDLDSFKLNTDDSIGITVNETQTINYRQYERDLR